MNAIILEDEHLASKRLKRLLNEVSPDIIVIASYETIEETAEHLINLGQPDILFLDIHVADGNSFELFSILDVTSKVIFTTAYDQYAIEAFRKNATDYLLKPLKREQLAEAITKATPVLKNLSKLNTSEYKNRFLIKFGNKLHNIKTEDVAYIYCKNKISFFYNRKGDRFPSDFKLQDLENLLNPELFFRANRQFIIHIESIESIQRHKASRLKLQLHPNIEEELVVSTEKTRNFKEWIDR